MSSPSERARPGDADTTAPDRSRRAPRPAGHRRRNQVVLASVIIAALLGGVVAYLLGRQPPAAASPLPLTVVARAVLPGPSTRFDYADIDAPAHALFLAQLGSSRLLEIDTTTRRVLRVTDGLADMHGVLVVPALHRVFATATGSDQLVALDEATGAQVYRAPTGDYPDGLVYAPSTGQIWISNETGGSETVVDAGTGQIVDTVALGGDAGNVTYDPAGDRILVDVQTRNEIVVIDPRSRLITRRAPVPGCDHDHSLILDPAGHRAYVACDGNAQLVELTLPDLQPAGHFPVGDNPDVLALDPTRRILYVAAESGVLTTLDLHATPVQVTGRALLGNNAHVVALDRSTGQAYFPVLNDNGPPTLLITQPASR